MGIISYASVLFGVIFFVVLMVLSPIGFIIVLTVISTPILILGFIDVYKMNKLTNKHKEDWNRLKKEMREIEAEIEKELWENVIPFEE